MKKIYFFKTKTQYDAFVREQIFTDPLITTVPLYQKLIEFVCNEKAPIFFEPAEYGENRNFANYMNFQVMRDYYDNKLVQNMFYLHEFMHMAQDLPRDPEMQFEDFLNQFVKTEYAASNETEILIHYRQPKVRDKVFTDRKILFDVIAKKMVVQPTARELLKMRHELIETNHLMSMFGQSEDGQTIAAELKHFNGNKLWAKAFYERVAGRKLVDYPYANVDAENYEYRLLNYDNTGSQAKYEHLVLTNVQNMYIVLDKPGIPQTFAECEAALEALENHEVFRVNFAKETQDEKQLVTA